MADDAVTHIAAMDAAVTDVSTAPGLGVEIEEEKLKRYRCDQLFERDAPGTDSDFES